MNKYIVAVLDKKLKFYPQIMVCDDTRESARSFLTHLQTEGNSMSANPSDYALYHVGTISEVDTKITLHTTNECLLDGSSVEILTPKETD